MRSENPKLYFKHYRDEMGFSSQTAAKEYLAAKNVTPAIDYTYLRELNGRVRDIIRKLNSVVSFPCMDNAALERFLDLNVDAPFRLIDENRIIQRLNNQGRRPEEVLFSWLRGFVVTGFFTPLIARLFSCRQTDVRKIGDDDFRKLDTFRRTPGADLELTTGAHHLKLEIQSGFQGVNDIKEHKVREAQRIFADKRIPTLCIHFDIFNGQGAFVRLDSIQNTDVNWVTRQQMEGQSVFAIDQNYFAWRFLDPLPELADLELGLS